MCASPVAEPVTAETATMLRIAFANVLTEINALCGVHAWRYYALPETFARHDALADPALLNGTLVPRYTMEQGLSWTEWDTHGLRFIDRDASHNLFLIAHNQLFSRPLVKVLNHLVENHSDIVSGKWKGLVRALQRRTELMVTDGEGMAEHDVPLGQIGVVKGENLGITTEAQARYLLDQVRTVQVGLEGLLSMPLAQQLMGQTRQDIRLYGFFSDTPDPMGYLNGSALEELKDQHPNWVPEPQQTSPQQAARQLRLMAVSLRHLYGVAQPQPAEQAELLPLAQSRTAALKAHAKETTVAPGSRFAFCAADPTRSIAAIKEHRTVPYDGPLRPRDVIEGLDKLAARWAEQPDWESVQARYGTYDLAGSRPLEAYLQAIRPLGNAESLFRHAQERGYQTGAPDALNTLRDQLIGRRPKEVVAERQVA